MEILRSAVRTRLWLVDDDQALAAMLREYLALQHFDVELHETGESALTAFDIRDPPSLVILDVTLPGITGFETLAALRLRGNTPIIMLTARGEDADRLTGLLGGADDYLPKPFNPLELVARIRAILRRSAAGVSAPDSSRVFRSGNLNLDLKRREVRVADQCLALTAAEMRVLEQLLQRSGEVISRAELTELALDRQLMPFDRSIDSLVSKLRRKLTAAGATGGQIRSLRRHGYVYDGQIDP